MATEKSPAWLAGYAEGHKPQTETCYAITIPAGYSVYERGEFLVGFAVGARSRASDDLIDEWERQP